MVTTIMSPPCWTRRQTIKLRSLGSCVRGRFSACRPNWPEAAYLGVSDRLARQWVAEHGEAHVTEGTSYLKGRGGVESPVNYLSAALRDDFKEATPAAPSAKALAVAAERAKTAAESQAFEKAQELTLRVEKQARAATMARIGSPGR